jgi:hypothetical protein
MGKEEGRWVADGTRSSPVARSFSSTARGDCCIGLEGVCVGYATGSRFRIAKDVPFLRVDYAAGADGLCGVREVAGSGDKVDELPWSAFSETLK